MTVYVRDPERISLGPGMPPWGTRQGTLRIEHVDPEWMKRVLERERDGWRSKHDALAERVELRERLGYDPEVEQELARLDAAIVEADEALEGYYQGDNPLGRVDGAIQSVLGAASARHRERREGASARPPAPSAHARLRHAGVPARDRSEAGRLHRRRRKLTGSTTSGQGGGLPIRHVHDG